jgi:hypothetical protein
MTQDGGASATEKTASDIQQKAEEAKN